MQSENQTTALLTSISQVAMNALGHDKKNMTIALDLIIGLCRYRSAMSVTDDEIELMGKKQN